LAIHYWLYGVGLKSDFAFPYAASKRSGIAEVRLREWKDRSHSRLSFPETTTFFQRTHRPDGSTHLRWPGLFEFVVSADGREVRGCKLGRASLESFHTYFLGQVVSFALLKQGIEQLHATVVTFDGRALALTGDCGRGKSTLAAALLRRGGKLLVDDMLVLQPNGRGLLAMPGPPRLKLMHDSAKRAGLSAGKALPMNPLVTKKIFPIRNVQSEPSPLDHLYVLAAPNPRTKHITIRRCKPAAACAQVIAAAYNLDMTLAGRATRQLQWAASIANSVPVSMLGYPRDLKKVDDVAETVVQSFSRG
jgi:hypothetical protein